jgi:hypothetical protein
VSLRMRQLEARLIVRGAIDAAKTCRLQGCSGRHMGLAGSLVLLSVEVMVVVVVAGMLQSSSLRAGSGLWYGVAIPVLPGSAVKRDGTGLQVHACPVWEVSPGLMLDLRRVGRPWKMQS